MATLREYEERLPVIYRQRYVEAYWVMWANALLDRLSGAGMLPPQHVVESVPAQRGSFLDWPANARNIIRITDDARQYEYRFVVENGEIRLLDATFPEFDENDPDAEPSTVTILYIAPYMPVESLDSPLQFGPEGLKYENLADTWFRWKVEEQVSAISQECAYWGGRVEAEFARLRAEMFNRMNKPKGRFLAGFR